MHEAHVASLVDTIKAKLRNLPLDEVIHELSGYIEQSLLDAARQRIEAEAKEIRTLRDPPAIETKDLRTWYPGPGKDDRYWPAVRRRIANKWNNPAALEQLDKASTRVVADLGDPHLPRFSTRGLVVGDVQSGKTSNFTATIAKAADAGYRLFVVMSGTKNKLRAQTQDRLFSDLVCPEERGWLVLTSSDKDFGAGTPPLANQVLAQDSQQRVLVVIKKHSGRLNYLLNWLTGAARDTILRTPTLIIDDEADEASINTAPARDERSRVNNAIVGILRLLPRVAFVGYTATPYANFFIDASSPEDLYPRDFIINLPSSTEYFGYEKIFGRERTRFDETDTDIDGYDMIRTIPDEEAARLRAARNETTPHLDLGRIPSLAEAIDWFLLATAARRVRGQDSHHSSMLVHTSQLTRVHLMFREPIKRLILDRKTAVFERDRNLMARLQAQWERETSRVPASEFGLQAVRFNDVWSRLPQVLDGVKVVIENSMSSEEQRLVYGQAPGIFIVVGGDVLSRGLTLEGLSVSYFTRSASTYDTLMQMGRWFGYRPGYGDLPRIWMTDELRSNFYVLGGIDREMRQLIEKSYSGNLTPKEFAPMIRIHPSLAVTSRMKMARAQVQQLRLCYGNTRSQTILFSMEESWLQRNIDAASQLISECLRAGAEFRVGPLERRQVLEQVDAELVLRFLEGYSFHENSWNLNAEALRKYIRAERDASSLEQWNVVIVEGTGEGERVRLGGRYFQSVIRSRLNISSVTYANIKSLMSEDDALADMVLPERRPDSIQAILELRNEQKPRTGLLVLYPIDRRSPPKAPRDAAGREIRVPLGAPLPVIGVGLVFPKSISPNAQEGVYVRQLLAEAEAEVEEPEDEVEEDDLTQP